MNWLHAVCILTMLAAMPHTGVTKERENEGLFPLHVSDEGKYLEDSGGRPFLVHGDTAWSLIAELTREEVETYLADRRRRGFNSLLVNLLEHEFSTNAPANAYGERPFIGDSGFTQLNDAYFNHAQWVLNRVQEMGFLVLLTPCYMGANGGGQGWYLDARAAGPQILRAYGETLGRRFARLNNIIWVHGGDFDVPEKALVRALAAGLEQSAPHHLQTVHSRVDTVTAEYWAGEDWLALDTAYTYGDTYTAVLARTRAAASMPVLMIEGLYEGEHTAGAEMVRRQAYAAILAGAAGHIYGNNPIWHFSGPGLYAVQESWQTALGSDGAESMQHMKRLFDSLPWWKLSTDEEDIPFETDGDVYAAAASDMSFAMAYLPYGGQVTLTAGPPRGGALAMEWFDPSNGRFHEAENGAPVLSPPAVHNAAGHQDWVLIARPAE